MLKWRDDSKSQGRWSIVPTYKGVVGARVKILWVLAWRFEAGLGTGVFKKGMLLSKRVDALVPPREAPCRQLFGSGEESGIVVLRSVTLWWTCSEGRQKRGHNNWFMGLGWVRLWNVFNQETEHNTFCTCMVHHCLHQPSPPNLFWRHQSECNMRNKTHQGLSFFQRAISLQVVYLIATLLCRWST